MQRVNSAVRHVVSSHINELEVAELGLITVTGAETSPDLRKALIWVQVLGADEETIGQIIWQLNRSHTYLQRLIAQELRLKRTPVLEFKFDDTLEKIQRIDQILGEED